MRRREPGLDAIFDILTMLPTWVGPVLAALSYPTFRYLIPQLLSMGQPNQFATIGRSVLASFVRSSALIVSVFILLIWVGAEIKRRTDRRRMDRTDSIEDIRSLSWREFELLVAEAYRRKGYHVEETGNPAGDGGVDLILHAGGERTLVQCKHWKQRQVGVKVVRELYGVMHDQGTTRGIITCFSIYTQEARDFAERNGIELVTGRELARLISEVKASSGPPQSGQCLENTPLSTEQSAAQAIGSPLCPVCETRMILRTAHKGRNAGRHFWGCPMYPRCRGTRQL